MSDRLFASLQRKFVPPKDGSELVRSYGTETSLQVCSGLSDRIGVFKRANRFVLHAAEPIKVSSILLLSFLILKVLCRRDIVL